MGHFSLIFLIISLLLFKSPGLEAQTFNPKCRYTSIGFGVKASYFDGDVATSWKLVRPGFAVNFNRRVSPRITLYSELMWLRVMGDDNTGGDLHSAAKIPPYIRNLNFRNDIKELSLGFKYDLFPSEDHFRKRPIYNVYASLGISFFYQNPKAKIFTDKSYSDTRWISLQPLHTENSSYSNFQFSIPVAIGLRYKLSLQWDMELEVSYRYTFTDYIDDVSGRYQDPSGFSNPVARQLSNRSTEPKSAITGQNRDLSYIQNELGHQLVTGTNYSYFQGYGPGDKRGTKKGNDGIVVFSVRFIYAIPGKVNCPKFRDFQ